ncbi:MAG TPA: Si-specific NAD(P)(+) transhydrogenase [Chloroflexota bacterium]|nr:Si-specific NAD(P)(+) transhydrogenase [Chloroflexota bacterium]
MTSTAPLPPPPIQSGDTERFDLVVIGSGPAGARGAEYVASAGRRVAVVERAHALGGAGINTGTLPSKTLRETALYLSGARTRGLYGVEQVLAGELNVESLLHRLHHVVATERGIVEDTFKRCGADLVHGYGRFVDAQTVEVELPHGSRRLTAPVFLVAPGSRPYLPSNVPFDAERVFTSDTILSIPFVPQTLAVVGAGVIGCEYASIFATLGVKTTLVDARGELLPHLDHEIGERLRAAFADRLEMELRMGHDVGTIERAGDRVIVPLKDSPAVEADAVLFAGGRQGNTDGLGLEALGIGVTPRGQIQVNDRYQTAVPHIYAAGDVVGFPALAATSMEQARIAMDDAFELEFELGATTELPYGIYTVPEIGMVGDTEQSLRKKGVEYEVGRASYASNARGQIVGDLEGMVKLLFDPETRTLLGAHVIGESATELVHLAAACMTLGGSLDYFVRAVFNYPTLADSFKDAAYDGLHRLSQRRFWGAATLPN